MTDDPLELFNQLKKQHTMATELGVRPELVQAVINQESGGRADALSSKGAVGRMQLMPNTAAMYPGDINNPDDNLRMGISHLKMLLNKYKGNEQLALAAYNAGEGNVAKAGNAVPNFPETKNYVQRIAAGAGEPQQSAAPAPVPADPLAYFNNLKAQQQAKPAEAALPPNLFNAVRPSAPAGNESGFIDNVLNSAEKFGKSAYRAVRHPIDTASDIVGLATGAAQSALPASATETLKNATGMPALDKRPYAAGMKEEYWNKYGDWNKIKHTLYTDPVGALADVSGLATGVGEGLSGVNLLANSSKLGKIAQIAKTTGAIADPIRLPGRVAGAFIQAPAEATARRIITSTVKPPAKIIGKPNTDVAGTILEENLGPNKRGANKAGDLIPKVVDEVTDLTNAHQGTYDLDSAVLALKQLQQQYSVDPLDLSNVDRVQKALDTLQNHPAYTQERIATVNVPTARQVPHPTAVDAQGNPIMQTQTVNVPTQQVVGRDLMPQTAGTINKMKRQVYKDNPGTYDPGYSDAGDEVNKTGAKALDKILDDNVPGVKERNDRITKLIDARDSLVNMNARNEKKLPLGPMDILAMLTAVGTNAVVGPLGVVPPAAAILLKHPTTAFPIAKVLHKVGTAHIPNALQGPLSAVTPATRVQEGVADVPQRAVDKAELDRRWESFLKHADGISLTLQGEPSAK